MRKDPAEQYLNGRQYGEQRGGRDRECKEVGDSLMVFRGDERPAIDTSGQLPSHSTLDAELGLHRPDREGCDLSHGVDAEAVQPCSVLP